MEFIVNNIYLPLESSEDLLPGIVSKMINVDVSHIKSYKIIKKAVDSRNKKRILFVYSLLINLNRYFDHVLINPNVRKNTMEETIDLPQVTSLHRPVIIGFGPCGMFAGLILARAGLRPIIIERGKKVEDRIEDVNAFKEKSILNPESNFCFGEGGAGTFSDGKLVTGVNDPKVRFVLKELIEHGAPEDIYYLNHPHVGSDKLINVVRNIRKEIISLGGDVLFETKFIDFVEENEVLKGIIVEDKNNERQTLECDDCILAIGHSARDTFINLYNHNLKMNPKAFSLGVRIEHLQEDLDKCQYGKEYKNPKLPRADYKQVVHLSNGRAVYTFCMCPGGEVVGTPTLEKTLVTNGMSNYSRDMTNCNAALLVNITVDDYYINSPLDGMYLQEALEKEAYNENEPYRAPCQKVSDFLLDQVSIFYGKVRPSYKPGTYFTKLSSILLPVVYESLREAIPLIGKKLKIYKDPDAIITGIETRSSSPIQIPRDDELNSSIKNLYPAGEGASYSGGITTSALDGIKVALKIVEKYQG